MSYVVTITRDLPISPDELRALAAADDTLSILPDSSSGVAGVVWRISDDASMPMSLNNGTVWGTPRTDVELAKFREIAVKLGAQLIGEEGENLTNGKPSRSTGYGCATRAAVVLGLVLLLAVVAAVV